MFARLQWFYEARRDHSYENLLVFEENIRMLHFTGLWRGDNEKRNWLYFLRRGSVWYMIFYAMYCIFICLPMYIYLHSDQFSVVSEALGNVLSSLMVTTNFLTPYLQNDRLNELVQLMREIYEKHCPNHPDVVKITKSTKKFCQYMSETLAGVFFYSFILSATISLYVLLKERDIEDRCRCWYPFDVRAPIVFEIVVLAFLFNFVQVVINTISTDAFILCMFLHLRAQLRVLQHKFRNLRVNAERVVADDQQRKMMEELFQFTSHDRRISICECNMLVDNFLPYNSRVLHNSVEVQKSVDCQMKTLLGECVTHYSKILKFVQEFEKLWNPVFSMKIFINLLSIVLILVSSSMKSGDQSALYLFTTVFIFYMEFAAFSHFAEQIAEEMSLLKDAIYDCDWTCADKEFKRSMSIIMSMANQPTMLRAGGFVPLSMETLHSVMKTAYSYYTVLRKF